MSSGVVVCRVSALSNASCSRSFVLPKTVDVVVFTLENCSVLCSLPSNVRTGPPDADASRSHKPISPRKGLHLSRILTSCSSEVGSTQAKLREASASIFAN
ncbi:unnamed protein product, partial [Ectocarpus sp. 13 AM-2016]